MQLGTVPEPQAKRKPWYRSRVFRVFSWAASAGVVIYTVVRLFGLETGWILGTTIAFVPYAAALALVGAGVQAAFRHWAAAIVSAAAALAMVAVVSPRLFADDQPAASGPELTVMSVNLYVGVANLEYVMELVEEHEPDVLSVQEFTPGAMDTLAELGLEDLLPHVIAEPGDQAIGTALYSAHPLERLEEIEPGGIFYQPAAEITLEDGSKARFMAIHTAAPASAERVPQWEADFAVLPRPEEDVPWILAGDFNATLDHDLLRDLISTGYTDAADATGSGLDMTWRPIEGGYLNGIVRPPAVALDHVLVDERAAVHSFEVLDKDGSDHAPVVAHIQLPG